MLISGFTESGGHPGKAIQFRARKSLGQNFLVSRDIAAAEAKYAKGMSVLELGPGTGILTKELCKTAKRVIAIEKDARLAELVEATVLEKNLTLVNADFFEVDMGAFGKIDIMVSNIPYNLSSKVIYWLSGRNIPALLCIQKEFAEHMSSMPGTKSYSKLSVVSSLRFGVHHVRDVPAGNFQPKPRVDSSLVYLVPKANMLTEKDESAISLIMNHKKKRLANAVADSASALGIGKAEARLIASKMSHSDDRPFKLDPEQILATARELNTLVEKLKRNR